MEKAPGFRIGNEVLAFVKSGQRIRPLRDHLVVEVLPVDSNILVHCWKPIRGRVLAAGKGHYPKQYDGRKGKRTKSWDSKAFLPCDVKVGDMVEIGGKEIGGYLNFIFRWGEKECMLVREADVALIVEN